MYKQSGRKRKDESDRDRQREQASGAKVSENSLVFHRIFKWRKKESSEHRRILWDKKFTFFQKKKPWSGEKFKEESTNPYSLLSHAGEPCVPTRR